MTSIIPSFHTDTPANYLDPNYVGDICVATSPSPAPSVAPTVAPSLAPTNTIMPSTVPSPQCLGASCISIVPSQFPSIDPSGIPVGSGNGNRGGFIGFFLALIQAIFMFLLTLVGAR